MEPLTFLSHHLLHRDNFEIEIGNQPECALFIIESGSFSCTFKDEPTQIIRKGDFVFFPQKNTFERHIIEPIDFHLIYFRLNLNDPTSNMLPKGIVQFKDQERQKSNYRIFNSLMSATTELSHRLIQHTLNDVFFQHLYDSVPEILLHNDNNKMGERVNAAFQFISDHYKEPITISVLAENAKCSVSSLTRTFKRETGQSPIEYLIGYRIRASKNYLSFTNKTINEIAELCGFENIYYFSNTFKRHCRCSPSEYRKMAQRV